MKTTHYERILGILVELKDSHPSSTISNHLYAALQDNFWGMSDEQFYLALNKYKTRLDMDVPHKDEDIDKIIKDGMNLHKILDDQEDD